VAEDYTPVETLDNLEIQTVSQDEAERRRIQERLLESERRFRDLFDDAPVACHDINQDGIVVRVNRAECELLGFQPQEMIGRPIWDFIAPDDRDNSLIALKKKLAGEQELSRVEREYSRRDGTTVFLEIHPKLIHNAAGAVMGIRSYMMDVTERKRAQQALSRQAQELARSNAELEQFAYVASHDLQEPLRKILAFGDRLKDKCGDTLSPEGKDYLVRMQTASARMKTLIQDLLALSRVATQPRPFAPVDLAETVKWVLSDLESRIEQLGGRVEAGPLPVVIADRLQMSQLFQNLIGNALKFHKPDEKPVVKIRMERTGEQADVDTYRIAVEDNGIGFDEKYLDRIFQVFQRLHGRNEYEGSGIGLAICRKIVERHGGSITASSTPGAGAKFLVVLPHSLPHDSSTGGTHVG
jgi:PAS domain S-box-containing protein